MKIDLRKIKTKIKILVRMSRPPGLITPLCSCFSGIYLANRGFPYYLDLSSSFVIIILLWFGGIILNDYYDYKVDSITDPYRPIPSGKIARKEVLLISIFSMSIAFLLSLSISINLSIITAIIIILAILYDFKFKKMGLIGSLCFGLIEGMSFMIGVYMVGGLNILILLVLISIILLHTGVNMIGAIKDIEGDKKTGNFTVPVRYGVNITTMLVLFFLLLSLIVAYIPAKLNLLNLRYMPTLLITSLWLIIVALMVRHDNKLGYMTFSIYYMGASIYYLNFITGINN